MVTSAFKNLFSRSGDGGRDIGGASGLMLISPALSIL